MYKAWTIFRQGQGTYCVTALTTHKKMKNRPQRGRIKTQSNGQILLIACKILKKKPLPNRPTCIKHKPQTAMYKLIDRATSADK